MTMSRGPGSWQRGILAALEQHPAIHLMALLPRPRTRAQVVALNRAARQLAKAGKIDCYWTGKFGWPGNVVVARRGYQYDQNQLVAASWPKWWARKLSDAPPT
jgi:hypothetical protein